MLNNIVHLFLWKKPYLTFKQVFILVIILSLFNMCRLKKTSIQYVPMSLKHYSYTR